MERSFRLLPGRIQETTRQERGQPYLFSVAQIFNLAYRRFAIGRTLLAAGGWQVKNLRYSAARRSRNATLPLLHPMEERAGERRWPPLSSVLSPLLRRGARKKNPRSEKSSRNEAIHRDTNRLQVCAPDAASTRNTYGQPCPRELDLKPGTSGQGCPRSNPESVLGFCKPNGLTGLNSGGNLHALWRPESPSEG